MKPPPPTKKRAPEIRALTGARGIPVLLIALFHYHEWYGYSGALWYDTIVSKGYIWVEFFFALSGFILFYAYGSRFGVGLKAEAIGAFLAARVSRIYPLQLATLASKLGNGGHKAHGRATGRRHGQPGTAYCGASGDSKPHRRRPGAESCPAQGSILSGA